MSHNTAALELPATPDTVVIDDVALDNTTAELAGAVKLNESAVEVTEGMEELIASMEELIAADRFDVGSLHVSNHAYRGLSSHLTSNPTNIVSSMEEAVVTAEVSTEALENVKSTLARAGKVVKETAKAVWAKILEILQKVTSYFDFTSKRNAALKEEIKKIESSDKPKEEFKVPAAAELQIDEDASFNNIVKGADNLVYLVKESHRLAAEYLSSIVEKIDELEAQKKQKGAVDKGTANPKVGSGNAELWLTDDSFTFTLDIPEADGVRNKVWDNVPAQDKLNLLLEKSNELTKCSKDSVELYKTLNQIFKRLAEHKDIRITNKLNARLAKMNVGTVFTHAAKTSRNLQKVVEAGLRTHGVTPPKAEAA